MNKNHFSPYKLFPILAATTVLLLVTLACGASANAPIQPTAPSVPVLTQPAIQPTIVAPDPGSETAQPPTPAIPERRRLTLEFPSKIRAGDSDLVFLILVVDDLGNITPTAQVEGNVVQGEVVEIPDLYETHNVIAEAKFDITGVQVSPPDLISQTLSKGQTVKFIWSVLPEEVGIYRGTIWFYLRFVDKVSGEESQKTVSAQLVEIEAVSLFGLPANLVRSVGGVGSVLGAIVGFPFFEDIVKFIFRKRKKRKK